MAEVIHGQAASGSMSAGKTAGPGSEETSRWVIFAHSLAFVLGFTLVFTLLGASAGLLGRSLNLYMPIIQKFGAIMLVIFALTTMGVFRWLADWIARRVDLATNPAAEALVSMLNAPNQLLYTEKRVAGMHQVGHGWGYLGSVAVGVTFAAGWTPCIGPILATILFLAGDSQTAWQGAVLLAIYSLGLGIPFLLTGAMFGSMSKGLRKLNRYSGVVSVISGLLMLYVAWLLWSDSLATLTTQFTFLNEWVFAAEDWVSGFTGTGGDVIGAGALTSAFLAFSAGLISFLSPCVLPLVPAYIGYLSGAVVGVKPQSGE
jgi:cytochrome c-type biogenesis protein